MIHARPLRGALYNVALRFTTQNNWFQRFRNHYGKTIRFDPKTQKSLRFFVSASVGCRLHGPSSRRRRERGEGKIKPMAADCIFGGVTVSNRMSLGCCIDWDQVRFKWAKLFSRNGPILPCGKISKFQEILPKFQGFFFALTASATCAMVATVQENLWNPKPPWPCTRGNPVTPVVHRHDHHP